MAAFAGPLLLLPSNCRAGVLLACPSPRPPSGCHPPAPPTPHPPPHTHCLQLPTAVLSTTVRAKARAAKKAKDAAAAGGEGGSAAAAGEAAMDTDQPAADGKAAEEEAERKEGAKAAQPEPSSFTGGR